MATFPSKVDYATGDILTATNMNDIGNAVNLLDGAQYAAGKNKIINGDFGVWQRGTSFTNPADASYTADRFEIRQDGNGTKIISQQTFTPGTAPVAGYEGQYFYRWNDSVAGTTQTFKVVSQKIEDVRTLAGQTATISFWAKADATRTVTYYLMQVFGSGGSGDVTMGSNTAVLSTSWQRFTVTVAVPSIAGKTIGTGSNLRLRFDLPLNVAQTIDFWGVQVEAASSASNFQTATGTKQGELAACQRYYIRQGGDKAFQTMAWGQAFSTTSVTATMTLPVKMRVAPTSVDSSTLSASNLSVSYAISAVTLDANLNSSYQPTINCAVTGVTAALFYYVIANNSTSAYLGFSAEL